MHKIIFKSFYFYLLDLSICIYYRKYYSKYKYFLTQPETYFHKLQNTTHEWKNYSFYGIVLALMTEYFGVK